MASLSDALALAKRGVSIFPLRPGTKDGFLNKLGDHGATSDIFAIYETFKGASDLNIGCWAGGSFLIIDIDADKGGLQAWEDLKKEIGPVVPTFTVRSARGGLHLYFETGGEPFGQADLVKGKINVRAAGGYVVGPGSTFLDPKTGITGAYTISDNSPIAPLPESLRVKLHLRPAGATDGPKIASDLDTPDAIARARARLEWAPPAIQDVSGDLSTFKLAAALLDFGITDETCYDLMQERWNKTCVPPWGDEELRQKIDNAWNYKTGAIGRDNPGEGFDPVPPHMLRAVTTVAGAAPNHPAPRKLLKYANEITLEAIVARESRALVKGLIHPGETSLIYGPPTAGKSFTMLDMGYAIAHERDWHGRRTKKAPVLYVSLEGVEGFEKRMLAATAVHGDPGAYFARLAVPVSLVRAMTGEEGAKTIIEAYRQLAAGAGTTQPGVIIIDTCARAMAGDNENDAADMMHFLEQRAGWIARETGAAVVIVHHPNKQGGIRGSSSLEGACEVVIEAKKDETGVRSLYAEKVKDDREGELFAYDLEIVRLGTDTDGTPITSCVVKARIRGGLSERETQCLELTKKMMCEAIGCGKNLSPSPRARNSAVGWILKNQPAGPDFTREEIKSALQLEGLLGLSVEKYENRKKGGAQRYRLIFPGPASSPPVDATASPTGAPPVENATGGAPKTLEYSEG